MALVEMLTQRMASPSPGGHEVRYRYGYVYNVSDDQAETWAKENPPSCRIISTEKKETVREVRMPFRTKVKRRGKKSGKKSAVKNGTGG